MRFVLVHKTASYLMVVCSLLTLFSSGEVSTPVMALALAAVAVSWFFEPGRVAIERFEPAWNVLTVVALGKVLFDVFTGGPLLIGGMHFILFLAINKLFNRRTSRDYLQLYVVSFLQIIAATVLNTELAFGVLFLLYVVFSTWTLILFHLRREMEENYLLKYGDSLQGRPVQVQRVLNSRKLVGGRFLLATSAVSLVVFLGSAAVFFLFPRVGFGFFFKKQRPGIAMAGFSEELALGHFGVIKDNPTVVMRVEFDDARARRQAAPYWRGTAFDHYDGERWSRTVNRRDLVRPSDGRHRIWTPQLGPEAHVRQSIYLEPMESRVLFGLSRLVAVELPGGPRLPVPGRRVYVERDAYGDVRYDQVDQVAFRYVAYSEPERVERRFLDQTLEEYQQALSRWPRHEAYLQLPPGLSPEVGRLARQLVGDARTVGEMVERVERHLRTRFAYTLDLQRDERYAPLEDFLFVQRRGHCEYFSTAMAILLRTLGIATRSVNGFYGGTWNDYGKYLAVSQGDAHSWVEVMFGLRNAPIGPGKSQREEVWMTRDPTPSGGAGGRTADLWTQVLQYTDALRLRWYKYVIEYDLQKQLGAIADLRRTVGGLLGTLQSGSTGNVRASVRRVGLALAVVLLLVAVGLAVRRGWRGGAPGARAPARRAAVSAAALYEQLLRAYQRAGYVRAPASTAREFLELLQARGAPGLELAREVVAYYEAARFGGAEPGSERLLALRRQLRAWRGKPQDG